MLIFVVIAAQLGGQCILDRWMAGAKHNYLQLYPEEKGVPAAAAANDGKVVAMFCGVLLRADTTQEMQQGFTPPMLLRLCKYRPGLDHYVSPAPKPGL